MRKNRIMEKVMWMLKSLLASYIVTGIMLLILTFLVYKFELDEQLVVAGIVATYVISTFTGGFILGKLTEVKKYIWGLSLGSLYVALLFLISYGVYRQINTNGLHAISTALLCMGGGMMGGMLS